MKFLGRIRKKSCRNCYYFSRIPKDELIMRCLPGRGTFCVAKQKIVNENYPKVFCMSFTENITLEEAFQYELEIVRSKKKLKAERR